MSLYNRHPASEPREEMIRLFLEAVMEDEIGLESEWDRRSAGDFADRALKIAQNPDGGKIVSQSNGLVEQLRIEVERVGTALDHRDGAILVWRFREAPDSLREMSEHGGDEDWVAYVPASVQDGEPMWAAEGTPFGCFSVSRHELVDGSAVLIGAHS